MISQRRATTGAAVLWLALQAAALQTAAPIPPGIYQFTAKANGVDMVQTLNLLPSGEYRCLLVLGPDSCSSKGKWEARDFRFIRTEQERQCADKEWRSENDGDVIYKLTEGGFALFLDKKDWADYRRVR